jgi:hypothetical protein
MASNIRPGRPLRVAALPIAVLAAGFLILGATGSSARTTPSSAGTTRGCPGFASQAAAQTYFANLGGSPSHRVGRLDPDRDGVACEELEGPYAGFANLGYNRARNFFYGTAAMPQTGSGEEGEAQHPCMLGNRHFSDGPRRLNVYRVQPGPDKRIFPRDGIGAEPREDSGHLVWKAEHRVVLPGRYYAEFEERIRLHPYGENECPAFRSHAVELPAGPS